MSVIGTVESLWRYPVKSMRGEELREMFVANSGVRGDRLFAFRSAGNRPEFPYFTGRDRREMLRYRPRFRESEINDAEALMVEVDTPSGETFAIDDPALIESLRKGVDPKHQLSLMRSSSALADAYPLSLISVQTAGKLGQETATVWDKRRFRANIYLDLTLSDGFAEDDFVGRSLRIGSDVVAAIAKRDTRCMMITLDPDTAEKAPLLLKQVAIAHAGMAGVYATVTAEGVVRTGDAVELLG